MNCLLCGKSAVYELRHSGHWLCKKHFTQLFERKVKKTIRQGGLLGKGDHILVLLDGSTQSMVCLKILNDIMRPNPKAVLSAALVDDGFGAEFSRESKYCESIGVEHNLVQFGKVKDFALKCGASKIALSDDVEDEVKNSLKALLEFRPHDIEKLGETTEYPPKKGISAIKVLREVSDADITLYAELNEIPSGRFKITGPEDRQLRQMIDTLERMHPGTKYQMLASTDDIRKMLSEKQSS